MKPITPIFVLYIKYTFIHFGMSISCKQGSLLIKKGNHVCLKENAVPICPDTKLSWCRTVFFNGAEMSCCRTVLFPSNTLQ